MRWAKVDERARRRHRHLEPVLPDQLRTRPARSRPGRMSGTDFTFDANGQMSPPVANLTLTNVTVDGDIARQRSARVRLRRPHPVRRPERRRAGQPAAAERLRGRPAAVDRGRQQGRIVGTYSNGRTRRRSPRSRSRISTAPNNLKRLDGGAFAATDEFRAPRPINASGKIVGSSLEGSNTDIADEFSQADRDPAGLFGQHAQGHHHANR